MFAGDLTGILASPPCGGVGLVGLLVLLLCDGVEVTGILASPPCGGVEV